MATKKSTTKMNSKKATNTKATKAAKSTAKKAAPAIETKPDDQTNDGPKPKVKSSAKDGKKMSALDAAAKVLAESKEPMRAREIIEQMRAKGYWTSPGGKTPNATVVAAIIREIRDQGNGSRFKKTGRGLFTTNS